MLRSIPSACLLLATVLLPLAEAANPIEDAQRMLQREEFYFGKVTGAMDAETRAALRRFQIHEGIAVTGEMDAATLQALQAGSAPAEPPPERSRSSVREQATSVEQDDRMFLERFEEPEILVEREPEPAAAPRVQRPPEPVPVREGISPADARQFVNEYLRAAEGPTPQREVGMFADRVDYFTSGRVSRAFVEKDQRNYYRRWPRRQFDLVREPEVVNAPDGSATVRFRIRYSLNSGDEKASGVTENIVRLREGREGLEIVGIRERKTGG